MPPLSSGIIAGAMLDFHLDARGLSSNATYPNRISQSEGNTLQILALVSATLSVASSILAFHWFVKMRRTFRHDLIMLLIQSDMFKALWFMVYPIVTFTRGPVDSRSIFCQVNGFFLSVGIEASDFAILMIAIHTALYIFKPKSSGREGGLYPYRKIAYVCWIIFPLLTAGLAFVNDRNAYISEGTYCYLPVRPFWYRLALSWIPRYFIFIFILAIYASIYYYVRYKFRGFNKVTSSSTANDHSQTSEVRESRPIKRNTLPPTPTLTCHGLIPDSRQTTDLVEGRPSSSTLGPINMRNTNLGVGAHRFMWASFSAPEGSPSPPSDRSINDADSFTSPSTPAPIPAVVYPSHPSTSPLATTENDTTENSRGSSWGGAFTRRFSPKLSEGSNQHSVVGMFSILRQHPDQSTATPLSQLQLTNSRGQTFADAEMLRTRDKVRRQLRFLFIYPLVYIGMWVLPFISHVMQYSDQYAENPPFALNCITTICVCSQAAIDCWLFSTREKPWRHIPGGDGSFWGSLKFWERGTARGSGMRHEQAGPGRTREEMVREARDAYKRRDEEIAFRTSQKAAMAVDAHSIMSGRNGNGGESSKKGGERSWWENPSGMGRDGSADLGTISPLAEEILNPMEEVGRFDGAAERGAADIETEEAFHSSGSETLVELEKFVFVSPEDKRGT